MKKFIIFLAILLLPPGIVLANFISYEQHILFSSLPSDLKTEVEFLGEGPNEGIFFRGGGLSTLKFNDGKEGYLYSNEILMNPPAPGRNSYNFWNISGTYEDKNFFIFGYTIDVGGDTWVENSSLTIDMIKLMLLVSFIVIIIFYILKKQKHPLTAR